MKTSKKILRVWFALASVFTFLGGWVLLAHAPKPVQPTTVKSAAAESLPPIQAFGDVNNSGLGFFSGNALSSPQRSSRVPLLTTGGS
jgi:hypothetical protein